MQLALAVSPDLLPHPSPCSPALLPHPSPCSAGLTRMSGLERCINLVELNLSNNQITKWVLTRLTASGRGWYVAVGAGSSSARNLAGGDEHSSPAQSGRTAAAQLGCPSGCALHPFPPIAKAAGWLRCTPPKPQPPSSLPSLPPAPARIEGLEGLAQLRRLQLCSNKLTRLEPAQCFTGLTRLESLALQDNRLGPGLDALGLQELGAALPGLRALYLQHLDRTGSNPVCRAEGYKPALLAALPGLCNLDGER